MQWRKAILATSGLWMVAILSHEAAAQVYYRQPAPIAPRAERAARAPVPRGVDRRPIRKPHSNIVRRPTVSPYLNLLRDEDPSALPNYYAFVRPQLEQIETNRRQQRELQQLDSQFQRFQAQSAIPQSGSTQLRPTGHRVRFMNLSHYYSR